MPDDGSAIVLKYRKYKLLFDSISWDLQQCISSELASFCIY